MGVEIVYREATRTTIGQRIMHTGTPGFNLIHSALYRIASHRIACIASASASAGDALIALSSHQVQDPIRPAIRQEHSQERAKSMTRTIKYVSVPLVGAVGVN